VRTAFAESLRVIWLVLIPFVSRSFFCQSSALLTSNALKGGVGFLVSLCMKALPLGSVTDEVRREGHNGIDL
jgi:hypothetical protein